MLSVVIVKRTFVTGSNGEALMTTVEVLRVYGPYSNYDDAGESGYKNVNAANGEEFYIADYKGN